MDEETVTATPSDNFPTISEPPPAQEPSPPPADPPSEPEPVDPVTVVSVDELIDRLVQSTDTGEEEANPDEPVPEEPTEEPGEGDTLLPEVDTGPMEIKGMDKLLTYAETIQQTLDHPALTTSFQDYTVTEGLLLLILLAAFAAACIKILKGGFSWLNW